MGMPPEIAIFPSQSIRSSSALRGWAHLVPKLPWRIGPSHGVERLSNWKTDGPRLKSHPVRTALLMADYWSWRSSSSRSQSDHHWTTSYQQIAEILGTEPLPSAGQTHLILKGPLSLSSTPMQSLNIRDRGVPISWD